MSNGEADLQPFLQTDDPEVADAARRHLAQKTRFRFFKPASRSKPKVKSGVASEIHDEQEDSLHLNADHQIINLDDSAISVLPDDQDVYKWAILYENQRGLTLFSSPHYSRLSLLPFDPLPFTAPSSSSQRLSGPDVCLDNYPLPDGTWRWVSKTWMIDMRTDSGEVQYDGFQYNWVFQGRHWRAEAGRLSFGGWVRRRRWVRLMMRPSQRTNGDDGDAVETESRTFKYATDSDALAQASKHALAASSTSLSSTANTGDPEGFDVWKGNGDHWKDYSRLMRRLGRDGRRLDVWKAWLETCSCQPADIANSSRVGRASSEKLDTDNETAIPFTTLQQERRSSSFSKHESYILQNITAVLCNHGDDILRSFVFPESRAQFMQLLKRTGLLEAMKTCSGRNLSTDSYLSTSHAEFWSYASGLDAAADEELHRRDQEGEHHNVERADQSHEHKFSSQDHHKTNSDAEEKLER